MYSNNIVNFQESATILNTCTKKSENLLNAPRIYMCVFVCGERMRGTEGSQVSSPFRRLKEKYENEEIFQWKNKVLLSNVLIVLLAVYEKET